MVLVNVSIFPHGTMSLEANDSEVISLPAGCVELYNACCAAAESIKESSSDTIILFSPHGVSLKEALAVYMNDSVCGNAEWNGYGESFKVKYQCDDSISNSLHTYLTTAGIDSEGVTIFSKSSPAPLRWGEVVPLWFLQHADVDTKVVIVGLPQSRFSPLTYGTKALDLGVAICDYCQLQSKRIALVFSCDLSHVHEIPSSVSTKYHCVPSLGTNNKAATEFDTLAVTWASTLLAECNASHAKSLLTMEMIKWVEEAKACGWSGMCCVQGCLERMISNRNLTDAKPWDGTVYEYQHPSYYGMMVASATLHGSCSFPDHC